MAEAFGIACHELVSLDFRFGSKAEVQRGLRNVRFWGQSRHRFRAAGCLLLATSGSSHHRHCPSNPTALWHIAMPVAGAVHCIKSGHIGPHKPSKTASCRDCD